MRAHEHNNSDFSGIFADISFACLGIFVLFLVVLLLFFKEGDVGQSIRTEVERRKTDNTLESAIQRNPVVGAVYQRHKKVIFKLLDQELKLKEDLDNIEQDLKSAAAYVSSQGENGPVDAVERKVKQDISLLKQQIGQANALLEKQGRQFNKYVPVNENALVLPFSVTGSAHDWYARLGTGLVGRELFKGFIGEINQGTGVELQFVAGEGHSRCPQFVKDYLAGLIVIRE